MGKMRILVVLLFAVALLFTVTVEGQRRVCRPNSVFKVDCNTCRCNRDGTDMGCTRMECAPKYYDFPGPSGTGKKRMCEPGSFFKMDCNNCRCNDDGTNAACTLKACPPF